MTAGIPAESPIRQILHEDLGCASYFVADAGEAAVVDPKWEIEEYLEAARDAGARIAHILETHHHADHVSGRRRLAAATGAAVHLPADPDDPLGAGVRPGDVIRIGGLELRALATDGHRPEHLAYGIAEAGAPEISALLSGDSLLVGDVARPDLAVRPEQGARDLWETLRRLETLPDEVELWPAHVGGSLCAASSCSDETSSTLGRERERNRMLTLRDRDAFVAEVTAHTPARPPSVERVVALNRLGATPERSLPVAGAKDLLRLLGEGACVLDARAPERFDEVHVAGAVNLPPTKSGMGTRAGWAASPDEPVLLLADSVEAAQRVAEKLLAAGVWNLEAIAAVDVPAWRRADLPLGRAASLDAEALAGLLEAEQVDLLDVRDPGEWEAGHVDGALHLPLSALRDGRGVSLEVPDGRALTVGCAGGVRAAVAASVLRRRGFRLVNRLVGGIGDLPRFGIRLVD